MNDFKVGDRVEYVGNVTTRMVGKVGVVVEPPFVNAGMVYFDHGGPEPYGAYPQSLTKLPSTDTITINRADLPDVEVNEAGWVKSANSYLAHVDSADPTTLRSIALQYLSAAEFLEAREKAAEEAASAEKEAAALLSKRRNDLAKEVAKKAGWNDWEHASYHSHQSEAQAAIDMMIAAEDDRG